MHNIKRISCDNKNIKEEENDQMCIGEWIQDVFRRRTVVCMRHFIQAYWWPRNKIQCWDTKHKKRRNRRSILNHHIKRTDRETREKKQWGYGTTRKQKIKLL